MKKEGLVGAVDLGSTKTCAVIGEVTGEERNVGIKILGVGVAKTSGVKRSVVRDIEETTRSIQQAMSDAERMAGVQVPQVFCGIAGEHVRVESSKGLASVTGDEISRADVDRVNDVAKRVKFGRDHELLHYIPQEYQVDNQGGISDPVGMTGLRLEVEMYLVSVQSTAAQNLRRSVERAGYRVADFILEQLAASLAVLTDEEKELGCALVDLGGGSTSLAVFQDGKIRHVSSIPFAGSHVTSDIVQGLGVTQADAETLKRRSGAAYPPLISPDEIIELPGTPAQGPRQAQRELLVHIISQRLDEILGLVQQDFEKEGFIGKLPAGVVLTGGGAELPGLVELAREVFAAPARLGTPDRWISGIVDSVQAPRYTVPVGLGLFGAKSRALGTGARGGGVDKLWSPVKRWLQDFF